MHELLTGEEYEYLKVVAYTLLRHGKWEKAHIMYEALDALGSNDADVTKGLALASFQSGKLAQALAATERWRQLPSSSAEAQAARTLQARILWAMGKNQEARACLTERESAP